MIYKLKKMSNVKNRLDASISNISNTINRLDAFISYKLKRMSNVKNRLDTSNSYKAGKNNTFEIYQVNATNILEITNGLLFSHRYLDKNEKHIKTKVIQILDKYYSNREDFLKNDVLINNIKELEKLVNYKNKDIDNEFFLFNIHIFDFETILARENQIIEYIKYEESINKLVLLIERLLTHLLYLNENEKLDTNDFLVKIYSECEKKNGNEEKWKLISIFFLYILKKTSELIEIDERIKEIEKRINNYDSEDLKEFIENIKLKEDKKL